MDGILGAPSRAPRSPELVALVRAVQRNCDRVDARHAADAGLCTYLLGMREYFRWERGIALGGAPPSPEVRAWITEREALWERCLEEPGGPEALPLGAGVADAWDEASVNRWLEPMELAYGAGLGRFGTPVFFLARRAADHPLAAPDRTLVDEELARGFTAPPAASRGGRITIRIDALRRWIWTRAEEGWRGHPDSGFGRALNAYAPAGVTAGDADLVERMVQDQVHSLLLHEQGEIEAGALLGPAWEGMLLSLAQCNPDRRTEIKARALRDLLADCMRTLPVLAREARLPALEFWFANLDGMRRQLASEVIPGLRGEAPAINPERIVRAAEAACAVLLARAKEQLASEGSAR